MQSRLRAFFRGGESFVSNRIILSIEIKPFLSTLTRRPAEARTRFRTPASFSGVPFSIACDSNPRVLRDRVRNSTFEFSSPIPSYVSDRGKKCAHPSGRVGAKVIDFVSSRPWTTPIRSVERFPGDVFFFFSYLSLNHNPVVRLKKSKIRHSNWVLSHFFFFFLGQYKHLNKPENYWLFCYLKRCKFSRSVKKPTKIVNVYSFFDVRLETTGIFCLPIKYMVVNKSINKKCVFCSNISRFLWLVIGRPKSVISIVLFFVANCYFRF